jgi:hypothetical protein
MVFGMSRSNGPRLIVWTTALFATAIITSPARAAFHLWALHEIYSNSSGTLQFIEMTDSLPFDATGGQNSVNGFQVFSSNVGNTQTNTFTIPGNPLPGNTLNHMLLFGTAGIQAAGGPAPDYIIPDNFLFTSGGSISFFGANSGAFGAMPTDGHLSVNWSDGTTALNSPTNYSGQSGTVNPVPEPSSLILVSLAAGVAGLKRWRNPLARR